MVYAAFGALAVVLAFPVLFWSLSGARGPRAASTRNLAAGFAPTTDLRDALLQHGARDRAVAPALAGLARHLRRITPAGHVRSVERRILLAGVPAAWTVERVVLVKAVFAACGLALTLLMAATGHNPLLGIALGGLGFFVPDVILSGKADDRQKSIARALPDTLDQITIMVEAGLGFDAAMARAARSGRGPLAEEMLRVLQDVQTGRSRADALRALLDRTDVEELRHFVAALLQAEGYGVPIANVLRSQAGELRIKRRQQAEERAMKLPVKIMVPLVLCILPTIFVVILGPAAIRIVHALSHH